MARGAAKTAQNQTGIENAVAQQHGKNSAALYNQLVPTLTSDVNNPTGFTPGELGAINTASQQSIGGATAGAVGQGALQAERTRNAGAPSVALDEAARSGERQLSQNAVEVQQANAELAQRKRAAALGQLQGLYGTNVDAAERALGLVPGTINAWTGADQASTEAGLGYGKLAANFLEGRGGGNS